MTTPDKQNLLSVIEHQITYSSASWEREKLWKLYHQIENEKTPSPKLPSLKIPLIIYAGLLGLVFGYITDHIW